MTKTEDEDEIEKEVEEEERKRRTKDQIGTEEGVAGSEIVEEMEKAYIDYAMSVIVQRALPSVEDGLKPVHRRILYSMHEIGLDPSKQTKKCAAIVGDVLGRFHPHGDVAVYDSLVRMAQNFSLRYPLVHGQGNFGCFTADTQVRLTDGRDVTFRELVEEAKSGKKNYTFTILDNGKIGIAEIKNPRKTIENAELVEVTLDNREKIKCTSNHLFLLKDLSYKQAQFLKEGDSLMPLYLRKSTSKDDKDIIDYEMVFQPSSNEWSYAHHLADQHNIENGIYTVENGRVRHHVDFNKLNNNPDNILRMQWKDHWMLHASLTSNKHATDKNYVEKLAKGRVKFWDNKDNVAKYSQRLSERNAKDWQNKEYRTLKTQFLSDINKKYWAERS